jgi:hypothetical protein
MDLSDRGGVGMSDVVTDDDDLRTRAVRRLKKKRDLQAHAVVYTLVNTFLIVIWAMTGTGFFWPVFPVVGWGIGLAMNVWDVYRADEPDEREIRREIERMKRSGPA